MGASIGLADRVFRSLTECSVVTVGAGTTVETALRVLRPRARGRLVVLNRTVERAEELAERFDGTAAPLSELPQRIAEPSTTVHSGVVTRPGTGPSRVAP